MQSEGSKRLKQMTEFPLKVLQYIVTKYTEALDDEDHTISDQELDLLQNFDYAEYSTDLKKLLDMAMENGDLKCVEFLVKKGVPIKQKHIDEVFHDHMYDYLVAQGLIR